MKVVFLSPIETTKNSFNLTPLLCITLKAIVEIKWDHKKHSVNPVKKKIVKSFEKNR